MSLTPGTRLGAYEVTAQIGVGGMGEVYRATDTNLKRAVAIKVLPDAVAADVDRLARFQREAEVLASLNHPNIAQIHGLEKSDGTTALVMELVEGPTLADRIAEGPFEIDDALVIAKQIAEALEAAHEQGIIHRDLKPANVKIRPDGVVKVLDFGLAKALDPGGMRPAEVTASPTMTSPAVTHAGVILGTAAYMSPEQGRGKPVDKRADIWAFGCVLFEMLTGKRVFRGEEVADALASVLTQEPDWVALPADLPLPLVRLLQRCLEKDPRRRLRDIGDARIEMEEARRADRVAAPRSVQRARSRLAWSVAAVAVAALLAVVAFDAARAIPARVDVMRTAVVLLPDQELDLDLLSYPLALSPDGSRLVYAAESGGRKQLYLRQLSDLEAVRIPGTAGASQPFFSPDGGSIAFFARGALWRVASDGRDPVQICVIAGVNVGGSWSRNDTIVFATEDAGLYTVAASGGTPVRVPGSFGARWPEVLPGGTTAVFVAGQSEPYTMSSISLDGSGRQVLARTGPGGPDQGGAIIGPGQLGPVHFVPTGHLLFGQGAFRVRALPFDPASLTVKGSPVSILDSVYRSAAGGAAYFVVSQTGVLIYLPEDPRRRLTWVDRSGTVTPIGRDEEAFRYPHVSPDGDRIAVNINTPERRSDVWIYDANRGTRTRLTGERHSLLPVWSRKGAHVAFSSGDGLVSRPWDRPGQQSVLLEPAGLVAPGAATQYPTSWSPDGLELLFTADHLATGHDLWVLDTRVKNAPRPLLVRPFNDQWAQFSPDGRWVAYASDETGVNEAYVARYPDMGSRTIVSTNGGNWPVWSLNGRELFYRQGNAVMAVPMQTAPTLRVGTPVQIFTGPYVGVDGDRKFDVSPDGRRFLMIMRAATSGPQQLVIVQNWDQELKQRVPTR